ncbi:DUF1996 domain-containing protein [Cryptosporangium aurantiacum]|uniref:DUF1996 domain-containing protein n=1 Tax=Cryptosporangium aurantiacum TaxID=134849 RepID=A0A1M7TZR3_9ACTN|nr:DUF1996 domain-containing protein [Cryptosporangium aurantiacum]SHN76090.1 protein of unknown function [Cryptosporangium aurantiacum]
MIALVVGIVVLAMAGGAFVGITVTGIAGTEDRPAPRRASPAAPAHDRPGPVTADFVAIEKVPRVRAAPAPDGTLTAQCGSNEDGHYNSDNMIVTPGITNGAHHLHDYVGNTTTSAASTDRSLAAAPTTCRDRGDRSAYYWPVLRDLVDATKQARFPGEQESDRNVGLVLRPTASLVFSGNPFAPVVAPPQFLRVITGDAKAVTGGGRNAHARFTCRGFTDRVTTDRYPLCPDGRGLTRILEFPSCWDGRNTDSANHRTHVVFPDARGACRAGTVPIPKLTITLTYDVPVGASFAIDSFPDQRRAPLTDHADFVNVRTPASTDRLVDCLNAGRRC